MALLDLFRLGAQILAGNAVSEVAILGSDYGSAFNNLYPVSAQTKAPTRAMMHPTEDGNLIVDQVVRMPMEITVTVFSPIGYYDGVGSLLRGRDSGELYTIQLRSGVFSNMVLTDVPAIETSDHIDAILLNLKFVEVVQVSAGFGSIFSTRPGDSNTVNRGVRSSTSASALPLASPARTRGSLLSKWTGIGF